MCGANIRAGKRSASLRRRELTKVEKKSQVVKSAIIGYSYVTSTTSQLLAEPQSSRPIHIIQSPLRSPKTRPMPNYAVLRPLKTESIAVEALVALLYLPKTPRRAVTVFANEREKGIKSPI